MTMTPASVTPWDTPDRDDRLAGTEIYNSVLDLVGNTPLVRLGRLEKATGMPCPLIIKWEVTNPGGSSKDRPALEMILAAERSGELKPGGTIVEPTSGNTGVGLAIVAAHRGYKCIFVTTNKVVPNRIAVLQAYGAKVVVCDVALPPEHPDSYYSTAERLARETPDAYRPNQYANPNNPLAHEKTTGPEIWRQTSGRITHFVAGAGTCGTVTGTGRYLKQMNAGVQIVAADPDASVFSGGSGRPYLIEGVGEDFFPAAWDPSVYDDVIACSDEEAYLMARQVATEEGVLLGSSGGLAVAAAIKMRDRLTPEDLVVVLIPDSGRGYVSRVYNDEWMAGYGFLRECDQCVGAVLEARGEALPSLLYVNPTATVRNAIYLMRANGVSQLPVCKNQPPFAVAEVAGAVDELALMDAVFKNADVMNLPVSSVMGPKLPTIGVGQKVELAVQLLERSPALLVLSGGRPLSVLTRTDVLSYLGMATNG
jgi:cystathionine beta-synthase